MPKSKFDRYSLCHNLLKKVAIRVDYSGVTSLNHVISQFKARELSVFNSYRKEITKPSSEMPIPQETHVFYNSSKFVDDVEVLLSASFLIIHIDCRNYKNIDPYLELVVALLARILKSDKFIVITRLGIRKIAAYMDEDPCAIFSVFEPSVFSLGKNLRNILSQNKACGLSNTYIDRLVFDEPLDIYAVYKRLVKQVVAMNEKRFALQAILDIEAFVSEGTLAQINFTDSNDALSNILNNINNALFTLFKTAVTLNYLENHGQIG